MKTIEYRAIVYAGTKCSNIQSEFHRKLLVDAFVSSYIKGAEEQRKIDIDKACKWLKARNVLTDASLEGFRHVMEG